MPHPITLIESKSSMYTELLLLRRSSLRLRRELFLHVGVPADIDQRGKDDREHKILLHLTSDAFGGFREGARVPGRNRPERKDDSGTGGPRPAWSL